MSKGDNMSDSVKVLPAMQERIATLEDYLEKNPGKELNKWESGFIRSIKERDIAFGSTNMQEALHHIEKRIYGDGNPDNSIHYNMKTKWNQARKAEREIMLDAIQSSRSLRQRLYDFLPIVVRADLEYAFKIGVIK